MIPLDDNTYQELMMKSFKSECGNVIVDLDSAEGRLDIRRKVGESWVDDRGMGFSFTNMTKFGLIECAKFALKLLGDYQFKLPTTGNLVTVDRLVEDELTRVKF